MLQRKLKGGGPAVVSPKISTLGAAADASPNAAAPPASQGQAAPRIPPLEMGMASPYTVARNPGLAQAAYVESQVMGDVANALTTILERHPLQPVHELATCLRDAHRLRALGDNGEGDPTQVLPILLDPAARNADCAEPRPSTATPQEATNANQSRHEVVFTSKPGPMDARGMVPKRFQRSGHHPVYGLDLPLSKDILGTVQHIHAETGAQRFHWIIVGTGDVQLYMAGRPYRGLPSGSQWNALKQRVDPTECPEAASHSRSMVGPAVSRAKLSEAVEAEAIRSLQASMRLLDTSNVNRKDARGRHVHMSAADYQLSVTPAPNGDETSPTLASVSPSKRGTRGAAAMGASARVVHSVQATIRSAAGTDSGIEHHFTRLQHPDDAAISDGFTDDVTKACDAAFGAKAPSSANAVLIVCGVDRWALVRHVQTLVTLYTVVASELHYIKRLTNVAAATRGPSPAAGMSAQQTFAREMTAEIARRRRLRDERRDWLVKGHVQAVYDAKGGDTAAFSGAIATDTANLFEKRTGMKQQRNQRRRREDDQRSEVFVEQSLIAARCIQKAYRGHLARRRQAAAEFTASVGTIGVGRGSSNTFAVPRNPARAMTEAEALAHRRALVPSYAEGEFPLIKRLLETLVDAYGTDYITKMPPQTGAAKPYRKWTVHFKRVEPVDDLDASSEEEEWESTLAERIRLSVQTAFNPLFDAQVAVKFAKGQDLRDMVELFVGCSGLGSLQRRSMVCLERFGHLVLYAAYLSFHLKRRVGADFGAVVLSPLQSQLFRLPTRMQSISSFTAFCKNNHAGQSLLENASWIMPFLAQQPSLLHRPSGTRLLIAGSTSTGSFYQAPVSSTDGPALRPPTMDILQSLHAKTSLFLAPEHLSIDQWTDAVAGVFKRCPGIRRVLWLSMRPEFVTYANDIPLTVANRPELTAHDASLQRYSTFHTENVNNSRPPAFVFQQQPLNLGGAQQAEASKKATISSRRPSRDATFNARDLALRSPTPLADAPPDTAGSISLVTKRTGNPHAAKEMPLPTAWLGINWDQIERELTVELAESVELNEGRLVAYTATGMLAGPHIPAAAVQTSLSDRPVGPGELKALVAALEGPTMLPPSNGVEPDPVHVAPPQSGAASSAVAPSAAPSRQPSTSNLLLGATAQLASRGAGGKAGTIVGVTPVEPPLSSIASTPRVAGPSDGTAIRGSSLIASLQGSPTATAVPGSGLLPILQQPLRSDELVMLRRHEIQITRPRRQHIKGSHQTTTAMDDSPDTKDLHPGSYSSGAIDDIAPGSGLPRGSMAPYAASNISLSERPSVARNRSHDTSSNTGGGATNINRKTLRGLGHAAKAPRQMSVTSGVSEALLLEDLDEATLRLPVRAADAFLTPVQAADEVRSRLKRRYSLDNALTYRRAPLFRTNGAEWLKAIDQVYRLIQEQLADPYLAMVVGVSDSDSVFVSLLAATMFALDHGKSTMLGVADTTPTQADATAHSATLASTLTAGISRGMTGPGAYAPTSSMLEFSTEAARHSDLGPVNRLVEENIKSEMHESLKFVDVLLQQTGLKDVVLTPIRTFMQLAEAEGVKLSPRCSLQDAQLMTWYASQAMRHLERYILLILFHHFFKFVVDRRTAMNVMQVDFSFAEHIETMPHVVQLLDHLDPWEGQGDQSPLSPFASLLDVTMRWRRRTWVASIG